MTYDVSIEDFFSRYKVKKGSVGFNLGICCLVLYIFICVFTWCLCVLFYLKLLLCCDPLLWIYLFCTEFDDAFGAQRCPLVLCVLGVVCDYVVVRVVLVSVLYQAFV